MRLAAVILMALPLGVCHADAFAQTPSAGAELPGYQVLRYNEEWSVLGTDDPNRPDDLFNPLKHIKLNQSGSAWLSLGGQYRVRVEGWDSFNFGAPPLAADQSTFVLNRLLYHADLHLGEHLRGFIEGKSALCTKRDLIGGCRTLETDEFALQNGFIDVSLPLTDDIDLTLRGGRQELLFGKQRLVSPLDWANTRRTFDGFSAILKTKKWVATGFLTRPVNIVKFKQNDQDEDRTFYGIYATRKVSRMKGGVDLYWMGLNRTRAAFNGATGHENRQTLGGRLWGKIGRSGFDYDAESAYQFGTLGPGNISAYMAATELGYTFRETRGKPRFFVGYDYASGDREAGDTDVETFNQLFPLGHAFFGFIDTVARQNISSPNVGASWKPVDKLATKLKYLYFWRASADDALYNAGGAVVRPGLSGTSSNIGSEIDLTVSYKFDRHALLAGGYSRFFTEDFIRQSGPAKTIDFLYLTFQYTF